MEKYLESLRRYKEVICYFPFVSNEAGTINKCIYNPNI